MKKVFAIALACAMLMSLLAGCGKGRDAAETTAGTEQAYEEYEYLSRDLPEAKYIEAAESFAGGSGTESDPYRISAAAELALMEKLIREDEISYGNAYYVLTADIALNDTAGWENWAQSGPEYSWQPITGASLDLVFDGGGHTISGMYINVNNEDYQARYGLFGLLDNACVRNLTLDKSYIAVSGVECQVGGIVGDTVSETVIENCVSGVTIDVYDGTVGGIVGGVSGGRVYGTEYAEDEIAPFSTVTECTFSGVITQVKEDALSRIGGIAGSSNGNITGCVNEGTILVSNEDADAVGGIAAYTGSGVISGCENRGSVNCTFAADSDTTLIRVGGIVGSLFLSGTGSEDYMSRGVTVTDCRNSGFVSGQGFAGGIAGSAANDHNDWCLTISNCINTGEVVSNGYTGGIVGWVSCDGDNDHGDNLVIENCRNEAQLSQGTVGGIIGQLFTTSGDLVIRSCDNSADLSTDGQHCAGVIAYWLMDSHEVDTRVTIEACSNSGSITSALNAGGIISYADMPVAVSPEDTTALTIRNCVNTGDLTVNGVNSYVGGILGNWGMGGMNAVIESCSNTGNFTMTAALAGDEAPEFTISHICGGIVGRLGSGLLLSTDNDAGSTASVNGSSAWLTIRGCTSTGTVTAGKAGDGYAAWFGGIIGNTCGEEGFSVSVEDCGYAGFDRGLGNEDYPDVGQKQ